MKVCITGGGGHFGQVVVARFQKEVTARLCGALVQGYFVNVIDVNFEPEPPGVRLDRERMKVFSGSILDEALMASALAGCDVCVHVAAYGMGGAGALNRELVFAVNVDGTNLVIELCKRLGVKRLVNSSSVGVIFTDEPLRMVDESHPYPDKYYSYYSESKALAEKAVKAANSEALGTVSLRYRGIYGPGEARTTGRAVDTIYKGLFCAYFGQDGTAYTQFSGIDNTAEACWLAAKALETKKDIVGGKVYTIVDGGPPVECFGFFRPVLQAFNQPMPFIKIPYSLMFFFAWLCELGCKMFGIPPLCLRLEIALIGITNTFSIEAARRDLGYDPKNNHDLTEVCSYYVDYYKKHPTWRLNWTLILVLCGALLCLVCYFVV